MGPPTQAEHRSRAHRDAVFNARLDQVTGGLHAVALVIIGGGAIRYIVDPGAPSLDAGRLVATFVAGLAVEIASLYLKGWRRPED